MPFTQILHIYAFSLGTEVAASLMTADPSARCPAKQRLETPRPVVERATAGEEMKMTKNSEAGSRTGGGSTGTKVKEQGSQVAAGAAQAGKHVMQTAAGQGGQVAREAGQTARGLVDQAQTELKDQAGMQQKRVAEGLRMLGDQLRSMAEQSGQPGMATDLVGDASGRVHRAADWLEQREPGQVVEEVRGFARHHPAAFLLGSAMAGALVGRLTRNLGQADGHGGEQSSAGPTSAPASPGERP